MKQKLQQSKCREILSASQENLKHAHSTEYCIMKREDGECHMKANFHTPDLKAKLYTLLLCSYPDPPNLVHSPQGMLLLTNPTGCCAMKRKDNECYIQAIATDPDPEVKLYHQGAYQRYIEKTVANMDYIKEDNKSMIKSPTVPEAKLHKRHNILSFYYVRSMISQGYINMQQIASKWNFYDILTKHWSYQSSYHELIHPVCNHSGNIAVLFVDNTLEVDVSIAEGSIFGILRSGKN